MAVTARGLTRGFGGAPVLSGLDLHVPAGQFLAVVGRSGSGKSTLLRLLGAPDAPDAGRVTLGGGTAADARIMFQEPRLLPWASVLDNVAVGLGPSPGPDGPERARATLERVGLGARAAEWPAGLSGSQKSRVALARALVSRPRMLMLDEPLGALDALTRIEMQDFLRATRQQDGFTALLVTHDVAEAVALADRIVVIEDGVLSMDVAVDLAPGDRRGSAGAAAIEGAILRRLLGHREG
ncbi:ATP-binding cassette domain-containing protein [Lichenibacterium dinghuense]|uniref:ATP-binding cassette domain-containing protein n=1 Tax=Lichenibacterium dinghuense TaxID=2895977 RepID=UPI001F009990|nr:ATP-binding cassette domain-containing protein [Lichenibacterium sp. 6Y81]